MVEKAEEAYHGEGKDYPLVNKDAKKFKSRMLEFWHNLVIKTKEEILYDDVLMPELIKVCFTTSSIRRTRHVRCLTYSQRTTMINHDPFTYALLFSCASSGLP